MDCRAQVFASLLDSANEILAGANQRDFALKSICRLLRRNVPHYNWVGFYVVDPSGTALTLGPFEGEPTEHVNIPFGRGVCGRAAATGKTSVVQDVAKETDYLSCSAAVKSEIVVPISSGGRIRAELDIDSHAIRAFADEDRRFLEQLCSLLNGLF
jgi:GAF domain-containing protein